MARLMVAAISALLFVTPGQQAPRPTEEALAKAETQTRQMYGVSIRKARKPADQAALARKLVEDALNIDDDPAGQFAILTMARKLAIVAKDRRVAIEVVTVVAERFKPDGPTDPGEQIKRGDELLEAAKKESAAKRFELQVEAAEWYVRAKLTGAGLNRELADKRLAEWRRPGEPLPGERSSGQRTAAMQSQLVGKWDIQHWPNRGKRTYIITPSGAVHFIEENRNTVLVRRENDILLDFGDGKLERLNPSNDRLFIEHFSPKSDFPDRPNQIGIGRRVEERQLKRKSE